MLKPVFPVLLLTALGCSGDPSLDCSGVPLRNFVDFDPYGQVQGALEFSSADGRILYLAITEPAPNVFDSVFWLPGEEQALFSMTWGLDLVPSLMAAGTPSEFVRFDPPLPMPDYVSNCPAERLTVSREGTTYHLFWDVPEEPYSPYNDEIRLNLDVQGGGPDLSGSIVFDSTDAYGYLDVKALGGPWEARSTWCDTCFPPPSL